MKKLTFKIMLTVIIFLLAPYGMVFGEGKSSTLMVSCTIPEIPGVNAPPFNLEEITPDENQAAPETESQEEENSSKDNLNYTVVVERTVTADKIIKTVYNK